MDSATFRQQVLACLEEYISEAEHQDGEGYWQEFPSVEGAIIDFATYINILAEDKVLPPVHGA